LHDRRFCVFDLEGTGIHFMTECITQIGAVRIKEGDIRPDESFNSLVKSPKPIPPAIERLTGISNEAIASAPSFPEAYERFAEFAADAVLVTQAGYEYDVPLLQHHCKQHRLPMLANPIFDTKALFTLIHPEVCEVVSTDFLIRYYGIDTNGLKRHDALDDCILIGNIFLKILQEYRERDIEHLDIRGLKVKRFQIPGMYFAELKNSLSELEAAEGSGSAG